MAFGTRGPYVTALTFDRPGDWLIAVESNALNGVVEFMVDVASATTVRRIGTVAPFSNTKTLESTEGRLAAISAHQRSEPTSTG